MDGLDVILYWFALTGVAGLLLVPVLPPGYMAICAALALVSPIALLLLPDWAPWLVVAAAFGLVFLPVGLAAIGSAQAKRERWGIASAFWVGATAFHPLDGYRETQRFHHAMALLQRGRAAAATALLKQQETAATPIGLMARLQLCDTRDAYRAILDDPRIATSGLNGSVVRLRALGEIGETTAMVGTYRAALASTPALLLMTDAARLMIVMILAGRPDGVAALHRRLYNALPEANRRLQLARAHLATGATRDAPEADLRDLSKSADGGVAVRAARALAGPALVAQPLSHQDNALLDRLIASLDVPRERPWWRSIVTLVLVAANLAMFAAEIATGGASDPDTLYALGALSTPDFAWGQDAWRLVAEVFLHFGPIHLAVNMIGLVILGCLVERMLGAWRFLVLYLGAGIGANIAIVLLARDGLLRPELVVGASGALMGLIGGVTGSALRIWLATRDPLFLQRIVRFVAVIVLQTAIDLTMPQVSAATHLCGMAIGFVLGGLLRFRWPAPMIRAGAIVAPAPPTRTEPQSYARARRILVLALAAGSIVASLLIAASRT